jgi:hypothetical protein
LNPAFAGWPDEAWQEWVFSFQKAPAEPLKMGKCFGLSPTEILNHEELTSRRVIFFFGSPALLQLFAVKKQSGC